jgi:cell division septal protein FtsQ
MIALAVFLSWRLLADAAFFKVSQVAILGDPQNKVSDQIRSLSAGQNLIFFPDSKIRDEILADKTVSSVTFEKKFPAGIVAKVLFRQALATWQSGTGRYLIDKEGVAYLEASNEQIPQASDPASSVGLGDKLPLDKISLIQRILEASQDKFNVLTIRFETGDVRIELSSGVAVLLNTQANLAQEEETLQLILGQAKIEGRTPRQIDLRYQKPIINY